MIFKVLFMFVHEGRFYEVDELQERSGPTLRLRGEQGRSAELRGLDLVSLREAVEALVKEAE